MPPDQWRRVRGEQEIIVRYEPERALATLPKLLADPGDREKLVTLVRRLLADERVQRTKPSTEQLAMVEHIGETLAVDASAVGRAVRQQSNANPPASAGREREEVTMERKHEKYQRLLDFCKSLPPTPTAVAHPCDESSLRGAVEAAQLGLIAPILVGPRARIEALAKQHGIDLDRFRSSTRPTARRRPQRAVELVREGKAEALMKGSLHTDELMGAVVKRETGLRTARRVSHCFVMDVPSYAETLIVTDAAVNIAPTMEDKVDIIQNAIDLAHAMRFPEVRVAILSAMETVNPKVPSTIEAAALCKMADRGQITGAILDGPLALDNAISLESVKIKKIDSPVAGRANVLVVPDLEAGNMLAKSLSFLAGADAAGIVLGARVPIILTSRADSVMTRLASCGDRGAGRARAPRGSRQSGGLMRMADAIVVLNAGSSSFKFSLFATGGKASSSSRAGRRKGCTRRRASSPRTASGARHRRKDVGRRRRARACRRARLPGRFPAPAAAEHRLVGVGHRVVHGGLEYAKPVRVDAAVVASAGEICSARAAAPAAQSRADPRAARAAAALPQVACFDTAFHRAQPPVAQAFALPQSITERGVHPLRLPRPVVRIHRAGAARARCARRGRQGRRAASRQRLQHVRDRRQAGASRARWDSPRPMGCRWARAAATSIPAWCCT